MKILQSSLATTMAALLGLLCMNAVSAQVFDFPTTDLGTSFHQTQRERAANSNVGLARLSDEQSDENIDKVQFAQAPTPRTPAPRVPSGAQTQPPSVGLPTTPNAPINQLPRPPPSDFRNLQNAALPSSLGATSGALSATPNIIGDLFSGGISIFSGSQTVTFERYAAGTILDGGPGSPFSDIAFEFGSDSVPNDVFTASGTGQDRDGSRDGFADTFDILEPIPFNDALTSPGPGFTFDGGQAVYTNNTIDTDPNAGAYQDKQQWFVKYSYTGALSSGNGGGSGLRSFVPVPGPGISARRIKISENFSPEVRDRFYLNYSFFNDTFGGLGDISRYIMGVERVLEDDLVSLEIRLPMAGTYGSFQQLDRAESRNFELGNMSVIGKGVLLRTQSLFLSGGAGFTFPTADDTSLAIGNREILRVVNQSVHFLPFLAAIYRIDPKTAIQTYMQFDIAARGDLVLGNLLVGPLANLGTFTDSTLLHLDAAISRRVYENRRAQFLRSVAASAEIHYTRTLQDSDIVDSNGLRFTSLKPNFNVVNTTFGLHLQLGERLVVTPAMAVPLSTGLDKQFDYEALLQVNYLR